MRRCGGHDTVRVGGARAFGAEPSVAVSRFDRPGIVPTHYPVAELSAPGGQVDRESRCPADDFDGLAGQHGIQRTLQQQVRTVFEPEVLEIDAAVGAVSTTVILQWSKGVV
ncbi:hypothetical protein [Mycobacterium sp. 141]|uniref:hypothetical protein n=1 Tax=Mycobacterium sp. 141 TaxID=1120797 RepID=UPI00037DA0BC|nr:hypothetical protein [Mycobacterium sp. 141]